jgi:HlyD family secretion protein
MKKKSNRLLYILITAVVALIIFIIIGKKAGWIGDEGAVKVAVEKVARRNIIEKVTASGEIYPVNEVTISPDVSGEIVELYVKEGDSVSRGQLLLKIQPDFYQAVVEQSEAALNTNKANVLNSKAQYEQAKAQLQKAKADYDRNKSLYDQKVISQSDWDNFQANYKSAEANVDAVEQSMEAAKFNVNSAKAMAQQAKDNLRKTTIYSPMGGIVSKLNNEKGERVVGTAQMSGTDILTIANLYNMEARVDVSENDVLRVLVGDTANVSIDAYPNKVFKGIVTQIANSSSNFTSENSATSSASSSTQQATNFTVRIHLLRDTVVQNLFLKKHIKFPFLPGMSASVDIMTARATNIIAVPIQAVTTRLDTVKNKKHSTLAIKDKLQEIVFVNNDGKAKKVDVTTGIQDDEYIQITSGLKGNEQVVTAPFSAISKMLKDSSILKVVKKEDLFSDEKKNE